MALRTCKAVRAGGVSAGVPVPPRRVAAFCRRWGVREFSLFGSVLRNDFGPKSDVDVMVQFAKGSKVSLWDWPAMQEELAAIFGRRVDLLEKGTVRNRLRKAAIEAERRVVYAA